MGNYKSRPQNSCSEEHRKKITELHSHMAQKLTSDLQLLDPSCLSELQEACCRAEVERVAVFANAESIAEITDNGLSVAHLCCQSTGSETRHLRILIQKAAVLTGVSQNGFTPLHLTAFNGDVDMTKVIIENIGKEGLDKPAFGEVTALHLAVMRGHLPVVSLLATAGANLSAGDLVQFTPLHYAAWFGWEQIAQYLLSFDTFPHLSSSVGDRPLHLAALKGHLRICTLLMEKGGDVNVQDDEHHTPIHIASQMGHIAIITFLVQSRFNPILDELTIYQDTALHLACYSGKLEVAKLLIAASGSDTLTLENIWSETPFHAACTYGKSKELVNYILDQGNLSVNFQGRDGHTPLHSACYQGHIDVVHNLLERGADINIAARCPRNTNSNSDEEELEDQTCLHWAYERGHDEIITLLKHFRRPEDDYSRGDYTPSGSEGSYVPVPSPLGKIRSITKEKIDVLYLRSNLPYQYHLQLNDIECLEAIGSGSFGQVFKGIYKGKTVAVKRYRTQARFMKSEVEMFCREVSILGSLNCPYVIKLLGACLEDPSQFAIVTEFISGGSLFSILHEHRCHMNMLQKLSIAFDVSKGMNYLHSLPQPIIHRDLNSHNILLHEQGRAVVADFGESRFLANLWEENMTKQPGNLRWMAPEVFTQCTKYSVKADVFSFALCFWELLAGELPFSHLKPAAAAADMAYRHARPPLHHLMLPEEVESLVIRAWDKTPHERPSFIEVVQDVQEALQLPSVTILSGNTQSSFPNENQRSEQQAGGASEGNIREIRGRLEQELHMPVIPLFHSHHSLSNEELKKKVNNLGYVLPENSYQYKYPTNTHLNNSSPKPYQKVEMNESLSTSKTVSPKTVKKVEFETEDIVYKAGKKTDMRRGSNNSPKPFLRIEVDKEDKTMSKKVDFELDEINEKEAVELCREEEPGTSDL